LMLTSFSCSFCVCFSYAQFLVLVFCGEKFVGTILKRSCLRREHTIHRIEHEHNAKLFAEENVKFIAGLDITPLPELDSLGVVSLTVLTYPTMEVVYAVDEFVRLPSPYVPEFLAIREAGVLALILRRHRTQHPPIDVLLIDGNGKWHSRECGLACHVGYMAGIPSVGVAKSFNCYPLLVQGYTKEEVDDFEEVIRESCRQTSGATALELNVTDPPRLAVVRSRSSVFPLFVSAGFHTNLRNAAELVLNSVQHSLTTNPIRLSDIRSRNRIDEWFHAN